VRKGGWEKQGWEANSTIMRAPFMKSIIKSCEPKSSPIATTEM